jgi:hypothetical protein
MDKTEKFQLQSVGADTGRNGELQWKMTGTVPWSDYPTSFWVEQDTIPQPPPPGIYPCIFTRGALTKATYDGNQDWMYKWRIVSFNTASAAPAKPSADDEYSGGYQQDPQGPQGPNEFVTATTSSQADHPRKTESFERGRAIELAVGLLLAGKVTRSELFTVANALYQFQADPQSLTEPIPEVEEQEDDLFDEKE